MSAICFPCKTENLHWSPRITQGVMRSPNESSFGESKTTGPWGLPVSRQPILLLYPIKEKRTTALKTGKDKQVFVI